MPARRGRVPTLPRHLLVAAAGLLAVVPLIGSCSGDDGQVQVATSTIPVLDADEFQVRIDEICGSAAQRAGDYNPAAAVSMEEAAASLRGLAQVTYEALTELGAIRPPEDHEQYQEWLELVLRTATQVDTGATALQAGEVNAGIAELNQASATSAQASAIGTPLGLDQCQFLDPAAAAPSTTILPPDG